jgi:rare lipoprotein A (peptidoglycan hydrolase)
MLAAVVSLACGSYANANPAFVSCYYPNSKIAGAHTPNPRHLPVVAHRDLPFGTVIRFTKGDVVEDSIVLDRGPHIDGREFDLDCKVMKIFKIDGVGWVDAQILGQ